jgi:hypothetical protein
MEIGYEVFESLSTGMGLRAKEFVPKNKLIWRFIEGVNVKLVCAYPFRLTY